MNELESIRQDILRILPHRYPFLLVDEILEIEAGKRAVGRKCVSGNEEFFGGLFPGDAIMPGILVLETIAQVGAALLRSMKSRQDQVPLLMCIQRARFRRLVVPGDVLTITVTLVRLRESAGWAKGQARVAGKLVCEMDFSFSIASM